MKTFSVVLSLVLLAIGLSTLVYIESAPNEGARAARMRGCVLCHGSNWATQPLSCLKQHRHGQPLLPLIQQCMLQAHPTLPGTDAELLTRTIAARQLPLLAQSKQADQGAALYAAKCAVCHGNNGQGQQGLYPPLQGSEWLSPSPQRPSLESIITHGLEGPISVKGEAWNSTMLPPGISDPQELQTLINYLQRFR